MKTLILLGRPGCGLCEQWEDLLHERFGGGFRLDWRDVDRDPAWQRAYGERIPVLLDADGALLCVSQLDLTALSRYLTAPAGPV